jgi:peptidoglycan lytic transglycosylase
MNKRRFLFVRLFLAVLVFFSVTETRADLPSSVAKYQNSRVCLADVKKLARYDHLIRYFTSFSYFVPHHTVSPNFIRALILAESGANPSAVSNKNALGLGQILLTTGQEAAGVLAASKTHFRYVSQNRLANLSAVDLFDPAVNILLTCFLVAKYNYKFDGKIELVVSAWNAGEHTESLSHGQHAPFTETENLIGKINAYYVYLLKQRIFR